MGCRESEAVQAVAYAYLGYPPVCVKLSSSAPRFRQAGLEWLGPAMLQVQFQQRPVPGVAMSAPLEVVESTSNHFFFCDWSSSTIFVQAREV